MKTESQSTDRVPTPIPIAPLGQSYYLSLVVLTALAPLMIVILAFAGLSENFGPADLPKLLTIVVAIEIPVFALLFGLGRRRSAALSREGLEIRAALYRRSIPFTEMDLNDARVLDLREQRQWRPRLKTNGYSLPGLAAGHFRGRHGQKLFCLVTAPRVLRLPLHDGSSVLLSAENPDQALKSIRTQAGTSCKRASGEA